MRIVFKGTVYSGKGEGKKFIDLPWVKHQIEKSLRFTPYSGTLNVRLGKEIAMQKKLLEKTEQFEICPEKGYCTGVLIRAKVEGLACGVIIPQVPNYPADVLEVIAPWCLRDRLEIVDGNEVTVIVDL